MKSNPKGFTAMKEYIFPYGDGSVRAVLDEKQVLGELRGHETPPIADIRAALRRSLNEPIDSAPLKDLARAGEKIIIIISDITRFWMRQDLVIPHLVDYLTDECGARAEDLTILVANGTHAPGDEATLRRLVTDGVYDRVRVVNHDCMADDLVYLGETSFRTPVWVNRIAAEADLVVCLGACTQHVMAGYGGGRKSIVPGVAGMQTICRNHAYSLDPEKLRSNPRIGNGVLQNNPLNEDMCEAAGMMKALFMVNLVMNAQMKLSSIFSGHYLTSWLRACREVDRIYRVDVPERADVVIASCGGYPKDMSLYQGTKTIDNVESGLKPGGTLILLIEARDGGGHPEYFDWIRDLTAGTIEERLRTRFTVPGYIFFLNCEQAQRYRVMLLTGIEPEIVKPMGLEAYSDMDELLRSANLAGKSIYVIPNGSTVVPHVAGEGDEK